MRKAWPLLIACLAVWLILLTTGERRIDVPPPESGETVRVVRSEAPSGGSAAEAVRKAKTRDGVDGTRTGRARGADAAENAGPAQVAFTGFVVDARTREPIAGATIACRDATAVTAGDGSYGLPCTTHCGRAVARADGYVPAAVDCTTSVISPARRVGALRMEPIDVSAFGTVVDARGRVAEGTTVLVGPELTRVVSGPDGRFGPIPATNDSRVRWRAFGAGHPRTEGEWDSASPGWPSDLLVQLPAADFVEGVVVDTGGNPAAGAQVHVPREEFGATLQTDSRGRFRWPVAAGRSTWLGAGKDGRFGYAWVRAGSPTRIVLDREWAWSVSHGPPPAPFNTPETFVSIELTVVSAKGGLLPGAYVEVRAPESNWHYEEYTDARGRCRVQVPAGPSQITVGRAVVNSETHQDVPRRITLPSPPPRVERPRTRADEDPPANVVGRVVTAAGLPVEDASVSARGQSSDRTDVLGRFSLTVPEGDPLAALVVAADGYAPVHAQATVNGPPVEVRLPARGALVVRLENRPALEDDERSVLEFMVFETPSTGAPLYEDRYDDELVADLGDRVRFDLAEGTWSVALRIQPGGWKRFRDVSIDAERPAEATYAFATFGRLRGSVRSLGGGPVPGAEVLVAATGASIGFTDEAGRFDTASVERDRFVPAGSERLVIVAEGQLARVTEPVDLSKESWFTATLARGPATRGVIVDGNGEPVKATIAWLSPNGHSVLDTYTDDDGAFEFEAALPPGRRRFLVTRRGADDVIVEADPETPLRIELR